MSTKLPNGFKTAEPYVTAWTASDAAGRDNLRGAKSKEQRKAFYRDLQPLIVPALDLLDTRSLDQLDAAEANLTQLVFTYPHIAQAGEVQGPDEAKHALARAKLPITRAPADL